MIERSIDKRGQCLFPYGIEVNTWWMNLPVSDDEVIDLYHAHGECEQYHSEIKTDMDLERLPSGKFETNELIMELAIIAYNILRIIGNQSLRKKDAPLTTILTHRASGTHQVWTGIRSSGPTAGSSQRKAVSHWSLRDKQLRRKL